MAYHSPLRAETVIRFPLYTSVASLFLVVYTTQPFAIGFWAYAEPLVIAFHLSAAACGISLFFASRVETKRAIDAMVHPFVFIPAALGGWSLMMAPFAKYPAISILGAPQSGQGAMWYIGLSVLVAGFRFVGAEEKEWRQLQFWTAISAIVLLGVLTIGWLVDYQGMIPVPDYAAFSAFSIIVVLLADRHPAFRMTTFLGVGAGVGLLVASQNHAAMIIALGAGIWAFAGRTLFAKRERNVRVIAAIVSGLALLLPALIVYFVPWLWAIESLQSRHLIDMLLLDALQTDTVSLVFGHGWGHTQDAFFVFLNSAGQNLWGESWDLLQRDFFHSHNFVLESLYSVGFVGAFLAVGLFIGIPLFCQRVQLMSASIFAVSYAALSSVWFELAYSVPFFALVLAALSRQTEGSMGDSSGGRVLRVGRISLAGVAVAQIIVSALLFHNAQMASQLQRDLEQYHQPVIAEALWQDKLSLAFLLRERQAWWRDNAPESDQEVSDRRRQLVWMMSVLEKCIPSTSSPQMVMTGLSLLADLSFSSQMKWVGQSLPIKVTVWGEWVEKWLGLAPKRTDGAITYLAWLVREERFDTVRDLVTKILKIDANDPVGLFYAGSLALSEITPEAKAAAKKLFQHALDAGIERLMPIDDGLKNWLRQSN